MPNCPRRVIGLLLVGTQVHCHTPLLDYLRRRIGARSPISIGDHHAQFHLLLIHLHAARRSGCRHAAVLVIAARDLRLWHARCTLFVVMA